jgi:hypothetical protein
LNGKADLRAQAAKVLGRKVSTTIWGSLPPGTRGWRIVPVVGRRDDPSRVVGEAIEVAGIVERKPRGGWTETQLIAALFDAARRNPKAHGGIVVFIDEMGKFLESAAQDGTDIYLFQQLAEAASRSDGRLLIVGVLHQAFEEYAHRLSHQIRDEWAKIRSACKHRGRGTDRPEFPRD